MSDVEKYGLFAVVFVGGLLLVIATQGGFGEGEVAPGAPEVIDSAPALRSPPPQNDPSHIKVVSNLPSTPFDWKEPPIPYPGPRSIAPVQSARASAASGEAVMHTVAKGETLMEIAKRYDGTTQHWQRLLALNPGLDPAKLMPGQVIRISGAPPETAPPEVKTGAAPVAAAPPAAKAPAGPRTHTVAKGDTLGEIAQRYYGTSKRADELFVANRDVLRSKDDLKIGQVLRIP